mgnify:CR=1 FL=1
MIVEIFCLLCACASAVTGGIFLCHNWWDFWIPLLLLIGGYILGIGLTCVNYTIFTWFVDQKHEHKKIHKWSRFWFTQGLQFVNFHAGARCKVIGKEKLPKGQRFVLIGNHRSNFDSMLISEKLWRYDIAFITKDSNMKIPWGNKFMRGLCYLPINREDLLQSLSQFKKASELIQNNVCSIGVFPEGKRQTDKAIGDFHEGAFNIAIKSGCPLVITINRNGEYIKKNFPWKTTKTNIEIIGVIPWEEICDKPAKAVSDMVHQLMYDALKNN